MTKLLRFQITRNTKMVIFRIISFRFEESERENKRNKWKINTKTKLKSA